jgi:hypothetical protein
MARMRRLPFVALTLVLLAGLAAPLAAALIDHEEDGLQCRACRLTATTLAVVGGEPGAPSGLAPAPQRVDVSEPCLRNCASTLVDLTRGPPTC